MSHKHVQSAAQVSKAKARSIALDLRAKGKTYKEISTILGTSEKTAFLYVERALEKERERGDRLADLLRQMEEVKLDLLWATYWDKAQAGDLKAAEFILRLAERRSKLKGLDAPVRSVTVGLKFDGMSATEIEKEAERRGIILRPRDLPQGSLPCQSKGASSKPALPYLMSEPLKDSCPSSERLSLIPPQSPDASLTLPTVGKSVLLDCTPLVSISLPDEALILERLPRPATGSPSPEDTTRPEPSVEPSYSSSDTPSES